MSDLISYNLESMREAMIRARIVPNEGRTGALSASEEEGLLRFAECVGGEYGGQSTQRLVDGELYGTVYADRALNDAIAAAERADGNDPCVPSWPSSPPAEDFLSPMPQRMLPLPVLVLGVAGVFLAVAAGFSFWTRRRST